MRPASHSYGLTSFRSARHVCRSVMTGGINTRWSEPDSGDLCDCDLSSFFPFFLLFLSFLFPDTPLILMLVISERRVPLFIWKVTFCMDSTNRWLCTVSCYAKLLVFVGASELGSCVEREAGLYSHSSSVPDKPYCFCGRKAPSKKKTVQNSGAV